MNRKLKKALKTALDAPEPTRKESFINSLPAPKTTNVEFCLSQLGYIRKRFWLLSILLLVGIYVLITNSIKGREIAGFVSACLPLLTLLGLSEIKKSDTFNMNELEMSCKYDLSKIMLFRLTVIGMFHIVLLLISCLLFKEYSQFETIRYMIYTITPFLLSSFLSLWIINHTASKDSLYICSGVTIFVSLSMVLLNLGNMRIYADHYVAVWQIVFLVILILLIKEIHHLLIERIESWNFA